MHPCRDTVSRIFEGIERGGVYKGSLLPILSVDKTLTEVCGGRGVLAWRGEVGRQVVLVRIMLEAGHLD